MAIRVEENVWIELSDGCRLAARVWRPAGEEPVPAILEYIPYRKRDGTRGRDEPMHGYFAEHGFAALRVDLRGSGDSDGHLADEYLALEHDDALEVIAWIAAQDWCTGAVGMMGKSWGGFNALQVAARRPPALKAIIAVDFTDNRYTDDIHYMGGCLLNENLWWGSIMLAYQARPPDPLIVGEAWREQWLSRLETLPFLPATWLAHQHYDEYWKHGSVCEDYSAIQCAVLAVGGWADAYSNSVPRILRGLDAPCRGIIGPWAHIFPHDGVPGPAIGFLQEAVRWWAHWLKGEDTGVMDEPALRAFVQENVAPLGTRASVAGRWVAEPQWPSPRISPLRLFALADGSLHERAGDATPVAIRSPQSHGKAAGEWMGAGVVGEHPTDQRLDDGGALMFQTDTLEQAVEILGAPSLTLDLAADQPLAQLCVRLSDVLPDGRVTRVSYQVLNLAHRDGHQAPRPLEPGTNYPVQVELNACGHRFAAGHRIRLSIASAYWPIIWPSPAAATLTVTAGLAALELPRRHPAADEPAVHFEPPEHGPQAQTSRIYNSTITRTSRQDHITGETLYVTEGSGGLFGEGVLHFEEPDTRISHSLRREMRIADDDPLTAQARYIQSYEMGREGWTVRIDTETELRATAGQFIISGHLEARLDGELVSERNWNESIARDCL